MNITSLTFNADSSISIVLADGTTASYVNSATVVTTAPVVAPTDTEVDILLSDGTTKKFVPAA